jgi:3-hydroxypropanoate dehydrogenase
METKYNMPINDDGLDLIFRKARTHNARLDRPVDDALLRQVHDLARTGPTSANMCPMRSASSS